MRRSLALLAALMFALSLSACGNGVQSQSSSKETQSPSVPQDVEFTMQYGPYGNLTVGEVGKNANI